MTYWELLPTLLICLAILAVPGLLIGVGLRLRGMWLAGAVPALGMTAIATATVVAPLVGVGWSIWPVLVLAVAAGVVLRIVTRFVPALRPAVQEPASRWRRTAPLLAVGLGAAVIGWRLTQVIPSPDSISQSYDNVFHLNAVRWIAETANASPLALGYMTTPSGALPFYPSGWHALVALVMDLSAASLPVAITAVSFAVACVVWPLGVVLVARTLFGRRPAIAISAGVLSAAFPSFPLLLLNYGVLYPMFLGYALMPIALAALIALFRGGSGGSRWASALLFVGVVPGMALAHPGAFVALMALSVPIVIVAFIGAMPGASRRARYVLSGLLAAYLLVGVLALQVLRPPADQIHWPVAEGVGQAVGEVLTASVYFMPVALVVAVLGVVGFVAAWRRRDAAGWTAIGIWLTVAILYVIVAASPSELLRDLVTGPFYNNIPRLAALYPIATAPLAALGAATVWAWATSRWRARREVPPVLLAITAGLAVFALALTTQAAAMREAVHQAYGVYGLSDDSWMLTPDELAMFDFIDQNVPEGDVIAGNPWTGTGLAYAFTGRPVVMPHLLMEETPEMDVFNDSFADSTAEGAGCRAARELDVRWILDFGDQQVNNQRNIFPGLVDLDDSDNVELVERIGDASLYRVTGCALS